MLEIVKDYLKIKEVEYRENYPMSRLTTIRLGGNAKIVAYPKSIEEVTSFAVFLNEIGVKYKVIGKMSNILVTDNDYVGVLIRTDRLSFARIKGKHIFAFAGATLPYLARIASEASLAGMEELSGIPGTLGGAVCGNAGAFGRAISDILVSAEIYDIKKKQKLTLLKSELAFSYRNSVLKGNDYLLLSAEFELYDSSKAEIKSKMTLYKEKRLSAQPVEPSLGSVFKRSGEIPSSKLIDLCGLKGTVVGGAEISKKHAGFIVNSGGATSENVKELVRIAEDGVKRAFGITLEREIEYLE